MRLYDERPFIDALWTNWYIWRRRGVQPVIGRDEGYGYSGR
jgi:hypothetical protein